MICSSSRFAFQTAKPRSKFSPTNYFTKGRWRARKQVLRIHIEFYAEIDPENSNTQSGNSGIWVCTGERKNVLLLAKTVKGRHQESVAQSWLDKWVDEDENFGWRWTLPSQSGKWDPEDYMKSMSSLGNLAVESTRVLLRLVLMNKKTRSGMRMKIAHWWGLCTGIGMRRKKLSRIVATTAM